MVVFDIEETLGKLTVEEKVILLSGKDFWHTKSIQRLSIPSLRLSDGPNGVRGTRFFNGSPAACFPCGTALGATWDVPLLEAAGLLMADEARVKGVHAILGPTVNIQRSPLGGRGFESFSEDPVLSGRLAGAQIRGIQSGGVTATIKHFVCNDQEHQRKAVNVIISDRALREIYLAPFQVALRESDPWALMTAYNKVNGVHVSEDPLLLRKVLYDEWGFRGTVISDWFGTYSVTEAVAAGLDLEMPGPSTWRGFALRQAVRANKIESSIVDDRVRGVLKLVKHGIESGISEAVTEQPSDPITTSPLLRQIAASSIVLLQNKESLLPFKKNKTCAVIGPNAKVAMACGGGSASLLASSTSTPYDAIARTADSVVYCPGVDTYKQLPLLNGRLRTAEGKRGFHLKFYAEPATREFRQPVEELQLDDIFVNLADHRVKTISDYGYYVQLSGIFQAEYDGEYTFGLTVYGTGLLYINGNLVVDNASKQTPGDSFWGAGTREETGTIRLKAGVLVDVCVEFGTAPTQSTAALGTTNMGAGGFRLGCARILDSNAALEEAVKMASGVDQAIICAGLNAEWESEGFDRATMDLPGQTNQLINLVANASPNTVVVVQSGTPVTMPWADKVPAIVQAWYGGNECGNAIADVLFGDVNPSGKLPLSFPIRNEDNPAFLNFRSEGFRTLYGEDVYVGYRFYEKTRKEVLFPFGHGLSYSKFTLSDLHANDTAGKLTLTVVVRNESHIDGDEVVQVYVRQCSPSINRPPKELKAFAKVHVSSMSSEKVQICLDKKHATSFWDEARDMWVMEKDCYELHVGTSSDKIAQVASFFLDKTQWWKGL